MFPNDQFFLFIKKQALQTVASGSITLICPPAVVAAPKKAVKCTEKANAMKYPWTVPTVFHWIIWINFEMWKDVVWCLFCKSYRLCLLFRSSCVTDEVMRAHVQVLHENIHLLLPLIQGFASQAPPADNAWPMLAAPTMGSLDNSCTRWNIGRGFNNTWIQHEVWAGGFLKYRRKTNKLTSILKL